MRARVCVCVFVFSKVDVCEPKIIIIIIKIRQASSTVELIKLYLLLQWEQVD